ncbi:DNA-binding LacI/PurR family transcriptional regulator [Vogesella indigofera]|uniref:DNA-binding LacI/PurR family transcriptional regulator n=1 Tax=Vogesella indigofera TaxID=45465 RepID=A0A495BA85_VOGIN|nr:LacI family DNA-binding transcriptional regulator [Vogesella indigofera]RKQ57849.1 DNA-binding LacI/PurR family transcriptional regulator [Vogesella indigofera]
MSKPSRATAADVALAAGVSKWTVTRAFTPGASIAEHSRERVLQEAAKLGYRPNLLARSLTTKTTNLVAILVDDFANSYKLPVLEVLTQALQAEQMAAVLININQHFDHLSAILDADQRQVDAVILVGTDFKDEALKLSTLPASRPPLYVLARESTIAHIPAVSCDASVSMAAINQHLWAQGYRRPGFMSGPRSLSTALGRKSHFTAFWQQQAGTPVPELAAGSYDHRAAAQALRTYLQQTPAAERIDVLMCENDALAIGAIETARHEFGLRVPQDLAIAGYDGDELAASPSFNLTSYRQPLQEMVAALIDMLKGRSEARSINLPGELIIRGST